METGCLIDNDQFDNYGSSELTEKLCDEMTNNPEFIIRRPVYQQEDLDRICDYSKPKTTLKTVFQKKCENFRLKSCLQNTIPILNWLPNYDWKNDVLGDVIAGFTVAVMHIPQGMAYAMLGNVPPAIGMYMAFFPVLIYLIFGTSRHNSMGTFAVICMMTGKVVLTHSNFGNITNNSTSQTESIIVDNINQEYSAVGVATAVTLGVAIFQLAMYLLRLGVISSLLSESLVSGFTTGAAFHVFTSQIKDLLGLKLPKRRGIFKVIYTYYDVFNCIDNVNLTAMLISGIVIFTIIFNNELIRPRINNLCVFPIPIEMITVVLGTLVSVQLDLSQNFNVTTVGHIPVGLPLPEMPPVSLLPSIMVDCLVITMVSYSISMSMALIFAQKMNYEVDANQELLAQGLGNLFGSFFLCMPFTASLSRSLVQTTVGGKTQLASLVSCLLLLFVFFWIGPFLEPLPKCVLAGIIVVALKGMFLQVKDLIKFCRLSSTDALVWIITFLMVVIVDIEYGLVIGLVLCFAKLITLSIYPYTCKLAIVPGTELYLDTKRYHKAVDIPEIKMFHYCGGLNFATKLHFKKELFETIGLNPQEELNYQLKSEKSKEKITSEKVNEIQVIILDFSALIHIDPTGVATLRSLIDDYMKIGVSVYLSGCSGPVFETIRKCYAIENTGHNFMMFPTVSDAVNYAKKENLVLSNSYQNYNSNNSNINIVTFTS